MYCSLSVLLLSFFFLLPETAELHGSAPAQPEQHFSETDKSLINMHTFSEEGPANELNQLLAEQDFFSLREQLAESKDHLPADIYRYFQAMVYKVFNDARRSNAIIDELLNGQADLPDTIMNDLYHARLLNHINLYEYGAAAEASRHIQDNYLPLNDASRIKNLENEISIWEALKGVAPQEITREKDVEIPLVRDKVGLQNIDVSVSGKSLNFIFDTGANFSFINRSLAEELGLRIIQAEFTVAAVTGKDIECDLAIADELIIGGMSVRNVVFLLMEDEDVSFPQVEYYPNGAIGFPVIAAWEELRMHGDEKIIIPEEPVDYAYRNFALDGLMPIIACNYKGKRLRMHFDTGATSSALFPLFLKEYKSFVTGNYEKQKLESVGGGGAVEFEGYIIDELPLQVADSEATLNDIRLRIQNIGDEESNFHGNFGQDYIRQFDEMIISFSSSSVLFR
jgi:hypothetical protein